MSFSMQANEIVAKNSTNTIVGITTVQAPGDIIVPNSPQTTSSAVNQGYVSSYVSNAIALSVKYLLPCSTVATSNITLSGLQTINGYLTVAGDRVLVTAQTTATQNSIYLAASGSWSLAADATTGTNLTGGQTYISNGTEKGATYMCYTSPGIVGTNALTFTAIAGQAVNADGANLTETSGADGQTIINANVSGIAPTTVTTSSTLAYSSSSQLVDTIVYLNSATALTITLPAYSVGNAGRKINIVNISATSVSHIIQPPSGTISGQSNYTTTNYSGRHYESLTVHQDGTANYYLT